ncbi:hypothetical protein NLU13_5091 [Sarocladium strictum]|uniref:Cell wall mannoprotein PIR1-like C-terminal domain-containing protein n=1 Tax=Sarocladium strictum TaxID=5046 RepID=A0AA39L9B6_SARSR|nr:hypothetical protein NLU13_5091 [Sarocladium strictum]
MKYSLATLGLASVAYAQGVTQNIKPDASAPNGCQASYSGKFEISVRSFAASKRDLEKRECSAEGALVMTLDGGVLLDSKDRTGYIAENYQFQFDKPAQAGAIYTAGFSACGNSSLALGGSAVWYQCLSGNFYNLYDRHWAKQCEPVLLQIVPCGGGSAAGGGGGAARVYTTTVVDQIGDGQPQVKPTVVTQIGDGQIQNPGGIVTQIGDGQIQVPSSVPPVTQIGDGQIQAPTGKPAPAPPKVTQIGDGQIQAPTAKAPAAPVVTQIGDGQIQAPTGVVAPPSPPAVTTPPTVPQAAASKPFPGTVGAFALAVVGFMLYL